MRKASDVLEEQGTPGRGGVDDRGSESDLPRSEVVGQGAGGKQADRDRGVREQVVD